MKKFITLVLFIALPSFAPPAKSAPRNRTLSAKLEKQGKSLYSAKRYKAAIEKFKEALRLNNAKFTIHFNLAQSYRMAGIPRMARKHYKLFAPHIASLKQFSVEQREALAVEVDRHIEALTIEIKKREVEAEAKKRAAALKEEERKLADERKRIAEQKALVKAQSQRTPFYKTWWFYTGIATTLLFAGGTTFFGLKALSENDEWESTGDTDHRDSAKQYQLLADISLGAALLAAGATVTMGFLYKGKSVKTRAKITGATEEGGSSVRFGISCFGPTLCGGFVGGRF